MRIDYSNKQIKSALKNGMDGILFSVGGTALVSFKGVDVWDLCGTTNLHIVLDVLDGLYLIPEPFKPIFLENK